MTGKRGRQAESDLETGREEFDLGLNSILRRRPPSCSETDDEASVDEPEHPGQEGPPKEHDAASPAPESPRVDDRPSLFEVRNGNTWTSSTGALVALDTQQRLCVEGSAAFNVLRGSVLVNGVMYPTDSKSWISLSSSPRAPLHAVLQFGLPPCSSEDNYDPSHVDKLGLGHAIGQVPSSSSCLILLRPEGVPLQEPGLLTTLRIIDSFPEVGCPVFSNWPGFDINTLADDLGPRKVLLLGSRGLGKSSLARSLVNALLLRHKEVLFLDFDPGQPEFSPPGTLSLHVVTEPMYGCIVAGHCTSVVAARFVGDVSLSSNPDQYLAAVKSLIRTAEEESAGSKSPIVANNHGWITQLGGFLQEETVAAMAAHTVLTIGMIPESLQNSISMSGARRVEVVSSVDRGGPAANYRLKFGQTAKSVRDARFLSYFCGSLAACPVYPVQLNSLQIHFSPGHQVPEEKQMAALNGRLVALTGSTSGECFGLAFVTACQPGTGLLYICTPLSLDDYSDVVDTLVQSSLLQLPTEMLRDPLRSSPYVSCRVLNAGVAHVMHSRNTLTRRGLGGVPWRVDLNS